MSLDEEKAAAAGIETKDQEEATVPAVLYVFRRDVALDRPPPAPVTRRAGADVPAMAKVVAEAVAAATAPPARERGGGLVDDGWW